MDILAGIILPIILLLGMVTLALCAAAPLLMGLAYLRRG